MKTIDLLKTVQNPDYMNDEMEMFIPEFREELTAHFQPGLETINSLKIKFVQARDRVISDYPILDFCYACHGYEAGYRERPPDYDQAAGGWGKILAAKMFQVRDGLVAIIEERDSGRQTPLIIQSKGVGPIGPVMSIVDGGTAPEPPVPFEGESLLDFVDRIQANQNTKAEPPSSSWVYEIVEPDEVPKPKIIELIPVLAQVKRGGAIRLQFDDENEAKNVQSNLSRTAYGGGILAPAGWYDAVEDGERPYRSRIRPSKADPDKFVLIVHRLIEPAKEKSYNRK